MVRRTDRPAMTIAVDVGRKATKQTVNCVTTGPRKMSIVYCVYVLLYLWQTMHKNHFVVQKLWPFSSAFKKIISRSGWGNSTPHILSMA